MGKRRPSPPSYLARVRTRLENKLAHAGIPATLDTSDATLTELQRQADHLLARANETENEHVEAKFLGIRATVLQALARIRQDREAIARGAGGSSDEAYAAEARAEFERLKREDEE